MSYVLVWSYMFSTSRGWGYADDVVGVVEEFDWDLMGRALDVFSSMRVKR